MTGYRSKFFRHDCRTRGCYVSLLPSWDDIIEALPRNIRPTDIDGMIECNGHFLFIEEKSAGKSLEHGQRVAMANIANQPNTRVVVIRPVVGSPTGMQALFYPNPNGFQDITRGEFIEWVRGWAKNADKTKPRRWTYTDADSFQIGA